MRTELHVCSLDQSKRLKTLGVKQYALWNWVNRMYAGQKEEYDLESCDLLEEVPNEIDLAAFTASELFAMIPSDITPPGTCDHLDWTIDKACCWGRADVIVFKNHRGREDSCKGVKFDRSKSLKCFGYPSLAESLAELLLWLLDMKYVSPEECSVGIEKVESKDGSFYNREYLK